MAPRAAVLNSTQGAIMGIFIRFLSWAASFRKAGQVAGAVKAGENAAALGGFLSKLRSFFGRLKPEHAQRLQEKADGFGSVWSKLASRMRGAPKPSNSRSLVLYDEATTLGRSAGKWKKYAGGAVGAGSLADLVYEIYKHLDAEDIQQLADFIVSAVAYVTDSDKNIGTLTLTSSDTTKVEEYVDKLEKATEIPKSALLSGLIVAGHSLAPNDAFEKISEAKVRSEFYNSVVNYITGITEGVSQPSKAVTANAILEIFIATTADAKKYFAEGLLILAENQKSLMDLLGKTDAKKQNALQASMLYRYSFGLLGERHEVGDTEKVEYELVDGQWVLKSTGKTTTSNEAKEADGSASASKDGKTTASGQANIKPAGVCGAVNISKMSYSDAVKLASEFNIFCLKANKSPRDMVEFLVGLSKFSNYCEDDLNAIVAIIHQRV